MKRSGPINVIFVLTVLVTFLTFCDKKKDASPQPAEANNNDIGSTTTSSVNNTTGITSIETTTAQITTGGTTTGGTTGSTTSKDTGMSQDTSNTGTQNTTLNVSTSLPGWTFDPCLLNPLQLSGTNGLTVVTLTFGSIIATGNYTLTSGVPGPGQVRMTVLDPPGQPVGSVWVSKSGGTVSVNVGTSTTIAAFTAVPCTQPLLPYPIVTVSGDVGCN